MSERLVWRTMYAEKSPPGRETLFLDGVGLGDYYQATGDVWRVRLWPEGRLQGGQERLVLTQEAARAYLLGLGRDAERVKGEGAE